MAHIRLPGRRGATAVVLALAALAVGSVFGTATNGRAASDLAPSNTALPTISGSAQSGSTLTAGEGAWDGTPPPTYGYAWSRCDENGDSCSTITGATSATYTLSQVDVGTTLRVQVTATNSDGTAQASSVPSAVIAAAPVATTPATTTSATTTTATTTTPLATTPLTAAAGCPSGTGPIQVGELSEPARLVIGQQTVTPATITRSATTLQMSFTVTACGDRPVQGALVYATAVPYNQYSIPPEGTTGVDGTVTLTMNQLRGFPADRRQQLLVVFVRAREAGESLEGGVSARTLDSFPVSLK